MLDNRYDLTPVLEQYPVDYRPGNDTVRQWSGGFSGSQIWRVEIAGKPLCLRRWPNSRGEIDCIRFIHSVLSGVYRSGFHLIPLPIPSRSAETFVCNDDHAWELAPWLPGEPDDCQPPQKTCSAIRVVAALTALGQFHRAVATTPENRSPDGPAPGILQRLEKLIHWKTNGLARLVAEIKHHRGIWPELADRSAPLIADFRKTADLVADALRHARRWMVPIQPCIRDIHREHVLFEGNHVTGLIDFGAMRPDSCAGDIARLIRSLTGDDEPLWAVGIDAFQQVLPLGDSERHLARVYDASGVLLSGMNWLEWVFVEGRQFADRTAVMSRFEEIADRLAVLANRGGPIIV
jgi:Ser/Thr protein kinase RdoA (MazF antagonist)